MEISFEFMMQSHTAFLNAKWFSLRYYAASTNSESLFFFVKYDEREMVIHNWNHFAQTHCSQPLSLSPTTVCLYYTHTNSVTFLQTLGLLLSFRMRVYFLLSSTTISMPMIVFCFTATHSLLQFLSSVQMLDSTFHFVPLIIR